MIAQAPNEISASAIVPLKSALCGRMSGFVR
jgi:hypothetical protein